MKVRTRYSGPTNTSGSKVTAMTSTVDGRRQTSISYPHALTGVDVHLAAVVAHIERLDDPLTRGYVDSIKGIDATHLDDGYLFRFITQD